MAILKTLFLAATAVSAVFALPAPVQLESREVGQPSEPESKVPSPKIPSPWDEGAVSQYPIHSSCNATQTRQIEMGLNEAIELAGHAKDHILRWGNQSEIYQKYFGDRPSMEAIGAFDVIASGDKGGVLFRCDNPDGNCELEGYGGHWRGENGTDETVICELSYKTRRSLITMCALGYNVAESETNTFWAADLMHRLYHMPPVGETWVEHYTDTYEDVIELAASNKTQSTHDSGTLQYFALEAYAYDIAVPGEGCPGPQIDLDHDHDHDHGDEPSSTEIAAPSSPSETELPEVSTPILFYSIRMVKNDEAK
ncbi:hypothetical protein FQN54_001500 [Arachnomyces sp. PD_36]|nr:hypothetical protein FQN54_001500 [Arachnomyces sp. PD_36]